MQSATAWDVISCLPDGRTLFHYYPDRYATYLLERAFPKGAPIADIKASRFAKLLQRPTVKAIAAAKGDGMLAPPDFAELWGGDPETYRLTLAVWGRDDLAGGASQTSRRGVNLVLQLNFSERHNASYRALVDPKGEARPFQVHHHPVVRRGLHTLSWARIDVEFDRNEALIEEVQCDWVRIAALGKRAAERMAADAETQRAMSFYFRGVTVNSDKMLQYFHNVLNVHMKMWEEATLTAAIWFVREELGLSRIFFHDYECGRILKSAGEPPRSLYTQLPSRFCFERTDEPPQLLKTAPTMAFLRLLRARRLSFWRLDL